MAIQNKKQQARALRLPRALVLTLTIVAVLLPSTRSLADGKVVRPRDYKGSLEEKAQEAIIIFRSSDDPGGAEEDLILKITVAGQVDHFAWIVPFPSEPKIDKEDPKLFEELFNYVEYRNAFRGGHGLKAEDTAAAPTARPDEKIEVISRQVVGDFDVAVVRETEAGGLNPWLEAEGYQTLDNSDDVLHYYRDAGYVYACIKVSAEALAKGGAVDSHPLRFRFKTGGRDGVYFPMRLTGLQSEPFDVNLYLFTRYWLNDKLSSFGYQHRGFTLNYRDWDTQRCAPNGGKAWSLPEEDPLLSSAAHLLKTVPQFFQSNYPGQKFYLTNVQARRLEPDRVRNWAGDLWLFPYYTNRSFVPYDVRPGAPAHGVYRDVVPVSATSESSLINADPSAFPAAVEWSIVGGAAAVLLLFVGVYVWRSRRSLSSSPG